MWPMGLLFCLFDKFRFMANKNRLKRSICQVLKSIVICNLEILFGIYSSFLLFNTCIQWPSNLRSTNSNVSKIDIFWRYILSHFNIL
jgi:hypothetical protein